MATPEKNNIEKIETVHTALPSWATRKPKNAVAIDVNLVDETEEILNTTQQTISGAKKTIEKFSQAVGSAAGAFFNNSDADKKKAYGEAKSALETAEEKINNLHNEFSNSLAQKNTIGLGNGSSGSYAEDASATIKVSA